MKYCESSTSLVAEGVSHPMFALLGSALFCMVLLVHAGLNKEMAGAQVSGVACI